MRKNVWRYWTNSGFILMDHIVITNTFRHANIVDICIFGLIFTLFHNCKPYCLNTLPVVFMPLRLIVSVRVEKHVQLPVSSNVVFTYMWFYLGCFFKLLSVKFSSNEHCFLFIQNQNKIKYCIFIYLCVCIILNETEMKISL